MCEAFSFWEVCVQQWDNTGWDDAGFSVTLASLWIVQSSLFGAGILVERFNELRSILN